MKRAAIAIVLASAACGRIEFEPLPPTAGPVCERRGYPDAPWLLDGRKGNFVRFANVDADGDLDIVAYDVSTPAVRVWHGNGNATFAPAVDTPAPAGARALIAVDLDGDGAIDVVTVQTLASTIAVLWGNGDGTFQPAVSIPSAAGAVDVVAIDFDHDGDLDLAVADPNGVTLHVNNGARSLDVTSSIDLPTAQAKVRAGNLDNDGNPDLVALSSAGAVWSLRGRSDGMFDATQSPTDPTISYSVLDLADVDGDGLDDVLLADQGITVATMRSTGATLAAEVQYTTIGTTAFDIAVGDVTGDRATDFVVADQGEDIVSLFVNRGDGTFDVRRLHAGAQSNAVALGDVDRDGRLDLAASVFRGVSLLLGTPGGLDEVTEYASLQPFGGTIVVDVDGDANLDMFALGQTGVEIWFGIGDGTFVDRMDITQSVSQPITRVSDMDGDGAVDLVSVSAVTGDVTIVRNTGARTFGTPTTYPVGAGQVSDIAITDLDGDRKPEVLLAGPGAFVVIVPNDGDGTLGAPQQTPANASASSLVAVDVNRDNKNDIELVNASDEVIVLVGNGDLTFQAPRIYPVPGSYRFVPGDFNDDAIPDLAVLIFVDISTTKIMTMFGDGAGNLTSGPVATLPQYVAPTTTARLGGPALDLVGVSNATNTIDIIDGRGDGTFTGPRSYLAGEYPKDVSVVDLDGKNGPDFVIASDDVMTVVLTACP